MTTLDLRFSKTPTSALLYGLFFEDINHALDGGLNADLIQNGSFNFCHFDYGESESKVIYEHMKFWTFCPNDCFSVTDKNPLHKNKPFSLRLTLNKNATATFKNLGYEIDNNQNYTYLPSTSCELSFFYSSRQKFDLHCFFEYANGHKSKGVTITPSATTKYQNVKLTLPCQKGFAKIVFEVSNANSTIDFANISKE